jgi:hypothetical protein
MVSKKKEYTLLTGGLGNQLFQYAFLLGQQKENKLLIARWGKPRLNSYKNPELLSFNIDASVSVCAPRVDTLMVRKAIGYLMRSGFSPKSWERPLLLKILNLFGSAVASLHLGKVVKIRSHPTLGYYPVETKKFTTLNVGYFQSFFWAENPIVYKKLMELKLEEKQNLKVLVSQAQEESPVVIHFRFGDYLVEHFGIPSINYYEKAVELIRSFSEEERNFWIFSDDISMAQDRIQNLNLKNTKFFSSNDFTTAESFQIMRLGHDYVIANSTFSWWAAFLSYNKGGTVVCPEPWFKNSINPEKLIPDHWLRLPAQY